MVRAVLVTATSLALTGAVVAHAYLLKHQFYPTVVYLTKSSPSMAVRVFHMKHVCVFCACVTNSGLFSGVIHSGVCSGVSAWKIHEESLFWTAKSCRDGGKVMSY